MAAIGNASKMNVWRVVGKGHMWTELLETCLTVRTIAVRVNQAPDCSKVTWLELGDVGAYLGYTTNDLMSWNAWVDRGHLAPLITNLVEVRMANTAEKDFNLNIIFTRITPRDDCRGKRRFRTCSRVSLCFILTI
jgi:hypothetical protein